MNYTLVKPRIDFVELVPLFSKNNIESCVLLIEKVGRTCYKSEDRIKEGSALAFTEKMIKLRHLAMVEHSNLVIKLELSKQQDKLYNLYKTVKSTIQPTFLSTCVYKNQVYIGGSLRSWMETVDYYDLTQLTSKIKKYISEVVLCDCTVCESNTKVPAKLRRLSIKLIHNRALTMELLRHRPASFAQESQRYVNYHKKNGVEFIDTGESLPNSYYNLLTQSADAYVNLIKKGIKPQRAIDVLTNACKTELVITTSLTHWLFIYKLRSSKAAHPDARWFMNRIIKFVDFFYNNVKPWSEDARFPISCTACNKYYYINELADKSLMICNKCVGKIKY